MMHVRHALVLLTFALGAVASAQEVAPGRATTGRITGRVVLADTGAPIAGATIVLPNLPGEPTLTAVSDADGVFDFPSVLAGRHVLIPRKAGFFPSGRAANRANDVVAVTVRAGLPAGPVTLTMRRGGAVTGRIVDEFGEPVERVQVNAMQYSYPDGRRMLFQVGVGDTTDDRGEFRVYGLPPGDFLVAAASPNESAERRTAGGLGLPALTRQAPTYFPGTVDAAQAQVLSLGVGQEASVTFTLLPERTFRISGTVINSAGAPEANKFLTFEGPNWSRPQSIGPNGTFTLEDVPPGGYWLVIRGYGGESGSWPVTVRDGDVTGLVLATTRGARLRGRVIFEGRPPSLTDVFPLQAIPRERRSLMDFGNQITVRDDGRFDVEGVSGRVVFSIRGKWMITSVTVEGGDVLDDGIDVTGKDVISGIRVTVTDRLTRVSGRVTGERGEPFAEGDVVVLRLDGVPPEATLGLRALRTDAAGRFEAQGLRPGSYVAAALEGLAPGAHFAPEFQERLRTLGRRFTLDAGQAVTLDLEPTPGLP